MLPANTTQRNYVSEFKDKIFIPKKKYIMLLTQKRIK